MPKCLQDFQPWGEPGWYEEDCDWSVVALAFPNSSPMMPERRHGRRSRGVPGVRGGCSVEIGVTAYLSLAASAAFFASARLGPPGRRVQAGEEAEGE